MRLAHRVEQSYKVCKIAIGARQESTKHLPLETGNANGLPTYSNSQNSIYASIDHKTGALERIRFFDENHKAKMDIEIHNEGKRGIFLHYHEIDFEKAVKGKKKQTGRGPAMELTPEIRNQFRKYIALLGKTSGEISNWIER